MWNIRLVESEQEQGGEGVQGGSEVKEETIKRVRKGQQEGNNIGFLL